MEEKAIILPEELTAYQERTFNTGRGRRLRNPDSAVEFVQERGFVAFWPMKSFVMPSLWTAVAGDRPVADSHHDPGHVTWRWKDRLLGKRRWYYGRVLKRRNAMISLAALPYFYALSPNFGTPELDYLEQYEAGLLTAEAKAIYEALLREGPLDTLELRRAARLTNDKSSRFNRALDDLQMEFKVTPTAIAEVGAWKYAFVYEIVPYHIPELQQQAHAISENAARQEIARLYLRSVGAARQKDFSRLFGWSPEQALRALQVLAAAGQVLLGASLNGDNEDWAALPELAHRQTQGRASHDRSK